MAHYRNTPSHKITDHQRYIGVKPIRIVYYPLEVSNMKYYHLGLFRKEYFRLATSGRKTVLNVVKNDEIPKFVLFYIIILNSNS